MKNLFGIIISLVLFSSCNTTTKESNSSQMSTSKIMFTDSLGNKISKEELIASTGTFNYAVLGIGNVPESAKLFHNTARQHGQNGDYGKAIVTLNLAREKAPNWAYPVYDLAYTYLLKDDFENALKYYRLTDSLEPQGFFTSKVALYTLEKEQKGEFQPGLYRMYTTLEWITNPEEKLKMIEILVSGFPTFAPGWKDYAYLLEGEERKKALEKGLSLDPDEETKGILLINKALTIANEGNKAQAIEILTNLIFDSNTTYGNKELAKFSLNNIIQE